MKIISNQQGGLIPPYLNYQVLPTTPNIPKQAVASEENKTKSFLTEDMQKFLYREGIPSDVDRFLEETNLFGNSLFNSIESPELKYKTILKLLPRIKYENDRLQQAIKQVEQNAGLGEIAVTSYGYVLAGDSEGKINKKLIQDVDLKNEYLLTNSDLINLRINDPTKAFNTEISNTIGNGIGMVKIQEYIKGAIEKLGTTTYSKEGYVNKNNLQILQGIKEIQENDGLLSVKEQYSNQSKQAQMAIAYIISSLPKNMLTVLQANAAYRLNDNSIKGVEKIISHLVQSNLSESSLESLTFKPVTDGKTSSGKKKSNGIDLQAPETLLLGMGETKNYPINMGTSDYMNVKGYSSLLVDKDGTPLANNTVQDVMSGQYGSLLDWNNIYMGNQAINPNQLNKIALNGNRIVAADLPIDKEAASRGNIKPDLDMLKRKEQADEYIRQNNITDKNQINQIYSSKEYNLPIMYNSNGDLNYTDWARFSMLTGYADKQAFSSNAEDLDDNVLLNQIDDENLENGIKAVLKKADKDYVDSSSWGDSNIFLGTIFIPMSNNAIMTSLGSKNYFQLPEKSAKEIHAEQILNQKRLGYVKPKSLNI